MNSWIYLALAGVNSCLGNLLLKYSRLVAVADVPEWQKLLSPWFAGGILFYVINVVLFAKALDHIPVSIGYPILAASGFALLAVASRLLFGEHFGMSQVAGAFLVVAGIICLAYGT
jgi:multidrug transporter EmrE-like cation transporter